MSAATTQEQHAGGAETVEGTLVPPGGPLVPGGGPLGERLLAHLDLQIASAGRLLQSVLGQAEAIREREVERVLVHVAEIQTEMAARQALEVTRARLLGEAGGLLGRDGATVTLEAFATLLPDHLARAAHERSARLRGLLEEVGRQHGINRVLMRQELAFLEHLTRLAGDQPRGAYARPGTTGAPRAPTASDGRALRLLDLEA